MAGQKSSESPILQGMTFSFRSPMIGGMSALNLGLPVAWVVKCKKCACTINCRAIDPQLEHAQPDKADPPPQDTVIVTCSCCWAAYRYSPDEIFKARPVQVATAITVVGAIVRTRRKSRVPSCSSQRH